MADRRRPLATVVAALVVFIFVLAWPRRAQRTPATLRRAVPRPVPFVVVKRRHPRIGDTYGHWWVELDGVESYGWWPDRCPLPVRAFLRGTGGTLNGVGGTCGGGTLIRDPAHGEVADHAFHPVLVAPRTDAGIRHDIRRFASTYQGVWRWSLGAGSDCRSFQLELLSAAGLAEPPDLVHTRGFGCPILLPARQARARLRSLASRQPAVWVRAVVPATMSGADRRPGVSPAPLGG